MFQELPFAFWEHGYNGNKYVYLINNKRIRSKVKIVSPYDRPIALKGYKWTEFALENIRGRVRMLHFIQEGDDTYYVTGYDKYGYELGGYIGIKGRYSRFKNCVWGAAHRVQV